MEEMKQGFPDDAGRRRGQAGRHARRRAGRRRCVRLRAPPRRHDGRRQRWRGRGRPGAVARPRRERLDGGERDMDSGTVLIELVVARLIQYQDHPHHVEAELRVAHVPDPAALDAVVVHHRRHQVRAGQVQDQPGGVPQDEVGHPHVALNLDDDLGPSGGRQHAHRRDVARPRVWRRERGRGGEPQRGRGRQPQAEARDDEDSLHGFASADLWSDSTTWRSNPNSSICKTTSYWRIWSTRIRPTVSPRWRRWMALFLVSRTMATLRP
jgi:hypothetical protein